MVFAPASYAYSLLPSSRRSSVASTTSSASSSRRSSLTAGGALGAAFAAGASSSKRRASTPTAVLAGFLVALVYFSVQAWTDPTLHDFLVAPPAPDSEDYARLYRTFTPAGGSAWTGSGGAVLPTPMYDDACLESWLGQGEPCADLGPGAGVELDAVISWVNGSDPLWYEQYAYFSSVTNIPEGWGPAPIRHYREKDELRHALRALHANLGGRLRTIHIILGDWPSASPSPAAFEAEIAGGPPAENERIGQMPHWLEQTLLGVADEEGVSVVVHHHAEFFGDRTLAATDDAGHRAYLDRALPTFNSFAIESQLANLPGLAAHWVALNDDFFISQPHSPSDWYTPAYGPLLRIESPTGMYGQVSPETEFPPAACPHERSALLRSNWLLSQRFGVRSRVPISHIPKVQSSALLAESAEIWADDFRISSARRFREVGEGETAESKVGDLHAVWLGALLLVERSREAMLWTWAVARMGGLDGTWGTDEREELASILRLDSTARPQAVLVPAFDAAKRPTTTSPVLRFNLGELGLPLPDASNVTFSSLDGPEPGRGATSGACEVDLDLCFGAFWSGSQPVLAEQAFKRLAFEHPTCGDCLLSAIVAASGPAGLSALLPPTANDAGGKRPVADVPHMPLTKDWQSTDFALRTIVPHSETVDLRAWCLRLIARYQYSLGEQSHLFAQVIFPDDIYSIGSRLERDPVSTLVLNDDLDGTLGQQRRASDNIRAWLDEIWPTPAWWERGFGPDAAVAEDNSV